MVATRASYYARQRWRMVKDDDGTYHRVCISGCRRRRAEARQGPPSRPRTLASYKGTLPRPVLRGATDRQLADYYGRQGGNGNVRRQLESEMNRRERAESSKQRTAERARSRKFARAEDVERRWQAAERATKGNMLNARGRRASVSERSLLTSRRQAERYGSDEMRAYLDSEHRGAGSLSSSRGQRAARISAARR